MQNQITHKDITLASTNIIIGVSVLTFLSFVITFFGSTKTLYLEGNTAVILSFCIPMAFILMGALTLIDFFAEDFKINHSHYQLAGILITSAGIIWFMLTKFILTITAAWLMMAGISLIFHSIKKHLHGRY